MAHYRVSYSIGVNNTYNYPQSVKDVVWKSAVYNYTEQVMVGETDDKVEADGKQVIALTSDKAKRLISEYQSSYPKPEDLPIPLRLPIKRKKSSSKRKL